MIASVWDWDSLTYSYYILPNKDLDAGGWGIPRGLESKKSATNAESRTKAFESVLPPLPDDAIFCKIGEECVGELYEKRDDSPRRTMNLEEFRRSPEPAHQKALKLIEDSVPSRPNEASVSPPSSHQPAQPRNALLWDKCVPIFVGVGAGVGILKYSEHLSTRSAIFVWLTGVSLGLTLGMEAGKARWVAEGDSNV